MKDFHRMEHWVQFRFVIKWNQRRNKSPISITTVCLGCSLSCISMTTPSSLISRPQWFTSETDFFCLFLECLLLSIDDSGHLWAASDRHILLKDIMPVSNPNSFRWESNTFHDSPCAARVQPMSLRKVSNKLYNAQEHHRLIITNVTLVHVQTQTGLVRAEHQTPQWNGKWSNGSFLNEERGFRYDWTEGGCGSRLVGINWWLGALF